MTATVIIPARLGSTRFPAKILAAETGKPLVQHVVDQARQCKRVHEVIVATEDQKVVAALRPFGTRCVLTDPDHPSGTDRVAEAALRLGGEGPIVNVQGDEPEIEPQSIDQVVQHMVEGEWEMFTAAAPFAPPMDPANPNLVKVVISGSGRAMYFSRAPIPFARDPDQKPAYYLHVGLYGYTRKTLKRLAGLKPTPCELAEKLEQLRAMENDIPIGVTIIERASHGIDTPQQYAEFVERYRKRK
ncbi:MAG: 3-deoxy-manno-octulosonate cytidylyltransferase [Tepidisphaeraceae bacterium]